MEMFVVALHCNDCCLETSIQLLVADWKEGGGIACVVGSLHCNCVTMAWIYFFFRYSE